MKIGFLDDRNERFTSDIMRILSSKGHDVSYVRYGYQKSPLKSDYRLIFDRQSLYDSFLKSVLKVLSLNGTYILNNPFSNICDDKAVQLDFYEKLKIPYPKSFILPHINRQEDMSEEIVISDISEVIPQINFPVVLKPHDGYAWKDVFFIKSPNELKETYEKFKYEYTMLLQERVEHSSMYRTFCFGKERIVFVRYLPETRQYVEDDYSSLKGSMHRIEEWTRKLNKFLDYDFNTVEWMIDQNGNPYVIDSFNETPEVIPGVIPYSYYSRITEFMAEAIEKIANSKAVNRHPFNSQIN